MVQIEMTNLAKMGTGFQNKCLRGLHSMAQALLLKLGVKPPLLPFCPVPTFFQDRPNAGTPVLSPQLWGLPK